MRLASVLLALFLGACGRSTQMERLEGARFHTFCEDSDIYCAIQPTVACTGINHAVAWFDEDPGPFSLEAEGTGREHLDRLFVGTAVRYAEIADVIYFADAAGIQRAQAFHAGIGPRLRGDAFERRLTVEFCDTILDDALSFWSAQSGRPVFRLIDPDARNRLTPFFLCALDIRSGDLLAWILFLSGESITVEDLDGLLVAAPPATLARARTFIARQRAVLAGLRRGGRTAICICDCALGDLLDFWSAHAGIAVRCDPPELAEHPWEFEFACRDIRLDDLLCWILFASGTEATLVDGQVLVRRQDEGSE